MRRPQWLERWREREQARPRSKIDHWLIRQREYVMLLPRWLTGSVVAGSLALGFWWAVTGRGLMRWLVALYGPYSVFTRPGTLALTTLIGMLALRLIAQIVRPRPPSNLPSARVRD